MFSERQAIFEKLRKAPEGRRTPRRWRAVLTLFPVVLASAVLADDAGFGPPISVPHDLPQTPHQLPARNWIDQTREEAMRKSQGCIECHKGIENPSMHVSQNVVLGCTDC